MENTEIIKINLAKIGEDYDTLKPFMKEWLQKIEESIQTKKCSQDAAVQILKGTDYSVKTISNEVNASRTTMYNHGQLLKRYIEVSAEAACASNPYNDITRLQNDKSLMQDQIDKLMQRDVDIELLKQENRNLSTTLEGKNAEIARLEERVKTLSAENQQLKGNSSAQNVVAFRKK